MVSLRAHCERYRMMHSVTTVQSLAVLALVAIDDVTDKTCFGGRKKPMTRVCGYNDQIGGGRLGNSVWIEHPQAKGYVTGYGHMLPGSVQVKKGDTVTCGQRLGRCGVSGTLILLTFRTLHQRNMVRPV